MPRTARASQAGFIYHVLNRGNARAQVSHKPADFEAFPNILCGASLRLPMPVLAYCLMPNHFHLVVRPHGDGDPTRVGIEPSIAWCPAERRDGGYPNPLDPRQE